MPWLEAASGREYHANVLRLASALQKRAWKIEALQRLIEAAIWTKNSNNASSAVALWLADPQTRDERVALLVKKDLSTVSFSSVFNHLHRHRQDLLDPYLDNRPLKGAFATGKTIYLLPAQDGFGRWLPRQQRRYASSCVR